MRGIDLDGARVLITGGGRGIGKATADAFARRGARVCIGDLDGEAAAAASDELGDRVEGFALDVTDRDSFADFVAAAEDLAGPTDVLVNNAGIMPLGAFLDEDDETSRATLEVNVWGLIHGMRIVVPEMIERGGGHVVNVTSMMGKLVVPGAAVYAASKYAAVGLTGTVREELAGTGVTISSVLPGIVKTELISGIPMGRALPVIRPERVAEAIVRSSRTRRAEVFVPWWMSSYDAVISLTPRPIEALIRRVLDADRVLTGLDAAKRAAYEARARARPYG